jgi:hypothetical protein
VIPLYAALKQSMGWPTQSQFNVNFDTARMKDDIFIDTTQTLDYEKRIEYGLLRTSKNIQHSVTDYYRMAWLPTVSPLITPLNMKTTPCGALRQLYPAYIRSR